MSFPLTKFMEFCNQLKIDSKEQGVRTLAPLLGTQRRFIEEVCKGMDEGVHWFVVLKPRQVGISTVSLALDLFWPARTPGLNGGLVMHDDAARDAFRATLDMYVENLPKAWRPPINGHNRNQLVFGNGSKLQYAVAGTKKRAGALGKSKALVYCHSTEVSAWGDPEGVASLKATFAETNPNRLFIWESTAQGFNHYYDMWDEAKRASTERAIFIGWWHNEFYRVSKDSNEYRVYWGANGKPTGYERQALRDVRTLYGGDIDDEQWAWYRWQLMEKQGDEQLMKQNYPTTEHEAFVESGSQFFNGATITELVKKIKAMPRQPDTYRVDVKGEFKDTTVVVCPERYATMRVWEEFDPMGTYIVAGDPAYGSSDWGDRFVASVWRGYADRMVQVAEFVDHQIDTYAFAWILAYLAGYYSSPNNPCALILEINGPGQAVLNEIQNVKRARFVATPSEKKGLANVLRAINQFRYTRLDSLGSSGVMHWQSTYQTKNRAMYLLRDYVARGMMDVRSLGLVEEMKKIVQMPGQAPEGTGRDKDDRVMGAALAAVAWDGQIRARLIAQGVVWKPASASAAFDPSKNSGANKALTSYLSSIGVNAGEIGRRKP